jgi:hypothetical protein
MITVHLLLMILAIVCLLMAAVNSQAPSPPSRYQLFLAAGLCLWAVASIVTV